MLALRLLYICVPVGGHLLPRQIRPQRPWTALPQTLTCTSLSGQPPTPTPVCSGTYTTYGLDATWTVVAPKAVITPNSRSLPVHTATVLAVQTTGTTYWPPAAPTVQENQRVRVTLVNKLDAPHAEKITLHFHGLVQNQGYVSMDGPESVSQW